jgi:hypothetical protein
MSDQETPGQGAPNAPAEGSPDSRTIESYAAEMNRKTDRLSQENQRLQQQLEQLVGMMQQQQQQRVAPPAESEKDLSDLAFTNPGEYAKRVAALARQEASTIVTQSLNQQNQSNAILNQLVNDYPELADQGSELTQKAVNIYKALSEQDRSSPIAYKAAVREAAAELGLLPKTRRSKDSSEPSIKSNASSSNEGSSRSSSSSKKADKLDDRTIAFAKAVGLNVQDPKTIERLQKRAQRKNWNKFEE